MKLHEAIEKLLLQAGRSMTNTEIAKALNENKWYEKKDRSSIEPNQIHGRTKNYPHLFHRERSDVLLAWDVSNSNVKPSANKHKETIPQLESPPLTEMPRLDISSIHETLMNQKNFKSASVINETV